MLKSRKKIHKFLRKATSVLLILSVMLTLGVPFPVFAEETEQEASDKICAFLYKINGSNTNLELVFQNDRNPDTSKIVFGGPYTDFASHEYHKKTYYRDNNANPNFIDQSYSDKDGNKVPWYSVSNNNNYIKTVTFKEEIKPLSIASWFYNCQNLNNFNNLENLNVSNCVNMAYAFYLIANNQSSQLRSLDLSCLNKNGSNTKKVKQCDFFIRSLYLENLDLTGLDLTGIGGQYDYFYFTNKNTPNAARSNTMTVAEINSDSLANNNDEFQHVKSNPEKNVEIKDLNSLVTSCRRLKTITLDGLNLSELRQCKNLFYGNVGLESLDLSNVISPKKSYQNECMFTATYTSNGEIVPSNLKSITLGKEDNLFEVATDLPETYAHRKMTLVYFNQWFQRCCSLESIDFNYYRTSSTVPLQYNQLFDGCSSLEKVENLNNIFNGVTGGSTYVFKRMFNDCSSLTEINMSGNTRALGTGELIFANCSSLKTLDLSGLGIDCKESWMANPKNDYGRLSFQNVSNSIVSGDENKYTSYNIYQGCDELAEVTFSPYYPRHTDTKDSSNRTYGSGDNYPPDKNWVKVQNPTITYSNRFKDDTKTDAKNANGTSYTPDSYTEVGADKLSSEQLFGHFKPEYAGRWVAISQIVLDANGGLPDKQFLEDSAKDMPINYVPSSIITPQRTGYTFAGWYSKKDPDDPESKELPAPNGEKAAAWRYYARWIENTYSLTLDANKGGSIPDSVTAATLSADTGVDAANIEIKRTGDETSIKFKNLKYSQFVELSKNFMKSNSSEKILTGWGDRPNGTGKNYGVNESVSKLTPNNNGSVTLYAQWYKPKAIITFDVNDQDDLSDPASPVSEIVCDSADAVFGDLALPQSSRQNYTFLYWYYLDENNAEHQVVDSDAVTTSRTLIAKWIDNPKVTFTCEETGGKFVDNTQKQTRICKYDSPIGVLPTPSNGKAAFKGWFSNKAGTGEPINAETPARETTYYAVWGYKLDIDTNGGSFSDDFSGYPIQDNKDYSVSLHTPTKPNATFDGWYTDPTFSDGSKVKNSDVLDLSVTNKIYAKWTEDVCEVTLDTDGGTLNSGVSSTIKVYNKHIIGELPTPTKTVDDTEYEFLGWYSGETKYDATSEITSSITLKAHWAAKNNTVTFVGNGGVFVDDESAQQLTVKVKNGGKIDCPPGINKTDFDFDGWYEDINDPTTKLKTSTVINGNKTYCAKWSNNTVLSADRGKIEYYVKWLTPSDANVTNTGDNLILHPTTSTKLSVKLRIYFSTKEGIAKIDKNQVVISVPNNSGMLKNRSGGSINCTTNFNNFSSDIFSKSNDTKTNKYVYRNGQNIINGGTTTYIDLDYTADMLKVAGGYIDDNGNYQSLNDNNINSFTPTITVNGESLPDLPELSLEVHTKVDTQNILKNRSSVFYEWQDSWDSANKPVDIENYFFVKWDLSSSVPSTSSQAYSITWSEDTVHDGTVVYTSGPVVTDNSLVQNKNNNPYWTTEKDSGSSPEAYVITMHRRDNARMNGNWANIKNEVILNVYWRTSDDTNKTIPYVQQFRKTVEANAYIDPSVGEGVRDFTKCISNYQNEGAHYINGGQELVQSGDMATLNKKLVYNYRFVEKNCFDNTKLTWDSETKTYTSPTRQLTLVDGEKGEGDVRISPVTSGNWNKWGASEEQNLYDTDYCFDTLTFNLTEYDVIRLDGNEWSSPFEHTNHNEYGTTDIYVRYEGEKNFSFYKTVRITEKDKEVKLPNNVVGFKIVHKTNFAATDLLVKTNLNLKATDRLTDIVVNDIVKERKTVIKNKARFVEDFVRPASGTDPFAGVTPFEVDTATYDPATHDVFQSSYVLTVTDSYIYAKKSLGTTQGEGDGNIVYDSGAGTVTVPAAVSGWGYNNSGYKKRLKKCVFRDLLPQDFSVDKGTVFVIPITENYTIEDKLNQQKFPDSDINANKYGDWKNSDSVLSSSRYSVEFEKNKNGTGRTMMVVTITIPDNIVATGATVYYKMKASQSSIAANTPTPINYVSFKDLTENQSVPIDRVDKTITDTKLAECYNNIDDEFTAYAWATTELDRPSISTISISSIVNSDGSTLSKHENVGLNMPYSYYIYYSNDLNTQMKNLVFYDVLERKFDGTVSDWEGTLKSVDVSSILQLVNATDEKATCKPVVYYAVSSVEEGSTQTPKAKADFSEADFKLELEGGTKYPIWSSTPPSDLSKVTAIAVDCRKDTKGNDFVLGKSQYAGFNINMTSPTRGENASMTYNDATILGDYVLVQNAKLNKTTSTDVTLHYTTPRFVKQALPSSGTAEYPNKVVVGSTLEYVLNVTNPDSFVPMYDVVLEDVFNSDAVELNTGKIKIKIGDEKEIALTSSPLVKNTHISDAVEGGANKTTFTTTISSIEPEQSVTIILPVTVKATEGTKITNAAKIKEINGVPYEQPFQSDPTYHVASSVVAKILKVNESGEPIENAKLQILDKNDQPITLIEDGNTLTTDYFMSTKQLRTFDIAPNEQYKLVELSAPEDYKVADPITFTVDNEGFHHIITSEGEKIEEQIEMTDMNVYNIFFHENNPSDNANAKEKAKAYKKYGPADIKSNSYKIDHFYDIPDFGDEYVFAGWYSTTGFAESEDFDSKNNVSAVDFASQTYPKVLTDPNDPESAPKDYHIYAKWIKVGTVQQASGENGDTNNYGGSPIRGFGLTGVQIRPGKITGEEQDSHDSNYNQAKPGGLRFVTSLSEDLIDQINGIRKIDAASAEAKNFKVEYGYVVARYDTASGFCYHYESPHGYKLQFKGENVNGTNTTGNGEDKTAETDYRYITNVDCTANQKGTKDNNNKNLVANDHRNFDHYRLYTLVINFDYQNAESDMDKDLVARSYLRYYDGNGKLRVFYNDYNNDKPNYYGGCKCNYSDVLKLYNQNNNKVNQQ